MNLPALLISLFPLIHQALSVPTPAEPSTSVDVAPVEVDDFFTTPASEIDWVSPFPQSSSSSPLTSRDGYNVQIIFCNRAYDLPAMRCGGACTVRSVAPNTCTEAPGTQCVGLYRFVANDIDVRNRGGCTGGRSTRLGTLTRRDICYASAGCYDTPGTQSFAYFS
ncbi:hypothetical protein DL98DRAFT_539586 [Cadophora sp. DSE1049]|nr:hypothetical protein DL98DRAFT_539586 [Cadophora sp. DSE1049]